MPANLGVGTKKDLEYSNIHHTVDSLDIRGVNTLTYVFDKTYVGVFPSDGAPISDVSVPVRPIATGDKDIVEVLGDGTRYLTRIRIPTGGCKIIYPQIEMTWSWALPF